MRNRFILFCFTAAAAVIAVQSCQSEQELKYARYYTVGKALYEQHCQNCHAADGSGLEELIPPLTDTTYLRSNKSSLACIIRYGMEGEITINGKKYDKPMPADDHLAPIEIAQIITFITNSFGNNQGLYDIHAVEKDLKDCR